MFQTHLSEPRLPAGDLLNFEAGVDACRSYRHQTRRNLRIRWTSSKSNPCSTFHSLFHQNTAGITRHLPSRLGTNRSGLTRSQLYSGFLLSLFHFFCLLCSDELPIEYSQIAASNVSVRPSSHHQPCPRYFFLRSQKSVSRTQALRGGQWSWRCEEKRR